MADPTREEVERVVLGLTPGERLALLKPLWAQWGPLFALERRGLLREGAFTGWTCTTLGRAVAEALRGEG